MSDNVIVVKESLTIRVEYDPSDNSMVILYLKGFLDTYNSPDFHRELDTILGNGYKKVIFECSELNYISSVGIGIFTILLKQLRHEQGDLVLVALQPKVYDIFQLLGFSKFFNLVETIIIAKAKFDNIIDENGASVLSHFPAIIKCPHCKKNLRATKSGKFRCSQCKKVLCVDDDTHVSFS